jgi:adenosylcobinamide kinase/adenosylcobinamide-phosphate guanylyltransferase
MNSSVTLITGGARSGKSRFAQQEALACSPNPVYIATARHDPEDKEFSERIRRHKADRDPRWTSLEEPLSPARLEIQDRTVVVDCTTLWLSNLFSLHRADVNQTLDHFKREFDALCSIGSQLFIVTNEIGMGVHAETELGRSFTDLQGWVNQYIASKAIKVVLMVSGIPVVIKEGRA